MKKSLLWIALLCAAVMCIMTACGGNVQQQETTQTQIAPTLQTEPEQPEQPEPKNRK